MNTYSKRIFKLMLIVGMLSLQTCKPYYFRSNYQEANTLLHKTENLETKPFLKAHIKNGDICILKDTWIIDTLNNSVSGNGSWYDFNRNKIFEGSISIPIDTVAIFETNVKLGETESKRVAALSILTGVNVILGVICVTVPKACFGSCPTFYINERDDFHFADAEGFSNAISPSMEYFDIDAIGGIANKSGTFSITMKNEALETHCVNTIKLLTFPKNMDQKVYQSPNNDFYLCENVFEPNKATEGYDKDISLLVGVLDRKEWFSLADENNLSSKEEIYLSFNHVDSLDKLGLIVNFRQTLMTTYFIYSAMGYMGDMVGDIFAKMEIEKETRTKLKNGIKAELGSIEVYYWNELEQKWEKQGELYETGPIAINRQMVPLGKVASSNNLKLKLVLNKGLWRIDYLALTSIKEKLNPIEICPSEIVNKGNVDAEALNLIKSPDKHLISMPGSEYEFKFMLPMEHQDYELFLYSKGYYLEWMRDHWIKDKNLVKLKQMVENPKKYLLEEAKGYKNYESEMEQIFWDSKIDTKLFSYYEN